MTSFQSLLSSIGGGQPKAPQPKTSGATNSAPGTPGSTRPPIPPSTARPAATNLAAGVKRKPDDQPGPPQPKTVRTEVRVPVRPTSQGGAHPAAKPAPSITAAPKPTSSAMAQPTAYRGTARPSGSIQPAKPLSAPAPAPKPAAKQPTVTASTTTPTAPTADSSSKPKRGFAAIMAKAKAAEEVAKAAGSSMIKHKTVEKMTKREREKERERAQQAVKANGKPGAKAAKAGQLPDRSRSNTPNDVKPGLSKKAPEIAYKGTMKKPVKPVPEIAYRGTMRKSVPGEQAPKPVAKKGMAQDKYGGYASWSDLSGAEDEEEDYESDASSMMEAGLDDVEAEETMALRAAKREDQEAMEEEERLRREKAERKKKLLALSKSAAAKKKY
ncbi:uncharacterized protein RCC_08411 [Ramularia collo-cygni]|uniref:SPT2 chromatin protein n=1 Tax=Ramularia collo-cygni TaxID=112498 RepID=A0A2D3V020_9PEZI|nr:uncharacterized protein RCC_08411 [Ramularia collo-cygni]CZT22706.1 uncharacterized protein RCC_08411 [Ramularia collo-cygni]